MEMYVERSCLKKNFVFNWVNIVLYSVNPKSGRMAMIQEVGVTPALFPDNKVFGERAVSFKELKVESDWSGSIRVKAKSIDFHAYPSSLTTNNQQLPPPVAVRSKTAGIVALNSPLIFLNSCFLAIFKI